MAEAVRLLVAGLPAEIVREIGLRLRGVAVRDFDNAQQMGRAASQGDAKLVILSDTLPIDDSIYVARRAVDANEEVKVAYCISMAQAEGALHALKEIRVDRFFLSPVDVEEMLRELARFAESRFSHPRNRTVTTSPPPSLTHGIGHARLHSKRSTRSTMPRSPFSITPFHPS